MFFTPELLARRDHGFGLLWYELAATLGSKSIFKKLPKRSVLTADIAQLCNLIVQPNEPLALRLSSNLMMGVVRIYKVKQETFFSDVSTCVSSLKKAIYELHALGEEQLQMGQPTIRSAAVTLAPDPKNAFMMEFDMLVADWDEYLDLNEPPNTRAAIDEDADYDPSLVKKTKLKARRRPVTDVGNASAHTLVEHHEHVLSASFDPSSFQVQNQGLLVEPSSNNEYFDFFPMLDEPAIGDVLGDELAKELGWETPPPPIGFGHFAPVTDVVDLPMNPEENIDPPVQNFDDHQSINEYMVSPMNQQQIEPAPGGGFSPSRTSQMHDKAQLIQPLNDITNTDIVSKANIAIRPRPKKNGVRLDQRTELTDDELKSARTQYMRTQAMQRGELADKRMEKKSNRLIETRIFGAPAGVTAPALIDFWKGTVKARLDARLGKTSQQGPKDLERPKKRRKTEGNLRTRTEDLGTPPMGLLESEGPNIDGDRLQSYEPGQGRYVSRPPSALGSNLGLEIGLHESLLQSQQSFMFPWDNAGPTSSAGGAPFGMSSNNQVLVEQADVRLRNSSRSRRESPISPSRPGSNLAGDIFSPAPVGRGSQGLAEDYQFDGILSVKSSARNSVVAETKQIEKQTQAVEKNSLNFLEYAKMQAHTLPNPDLELSFDTIVPKLTSSRHVAAAAFYHCLVLGTKDLLRFKQTEPHGPIAINITKRV
ncbi:hypothetical protein M378DRAFT_66503 [Amanita muscaria Koide BX008]|uniref:Uncharacterized protein n=1 Tax=Amanita muscaria (strain Koide BX008) TaxID=946122 RepID=A0A0C2TU50_AMAMK|nr:hypothetical protein M378DRAFT_66503 [Amanita muscaria Koide BX008]